MNQDFGRILRENVSEYEGLHHEIIRKAPELYNLATDLLFDSQIDSPNRLKLLAAIGYFIIPEDLYPEEEHGAIGYVEDIMLLQHIFREINSSIGNGPLVRYWKDSPEDLAEILDVHYKRLKAAYPDLYNEVVNFVGI
jgi:uncharacterized membrane protein YkvA (DUF1232 family)